MPNVSYGENIAKWGELARAILQQAELVKLFEDDGIKESELKAIDTTEQEAERADRAQREAIQSVQRIGVELVKEKDELIVVFGELKRKAANAIDDLEESKQLNEAQALRDIDFSSTATPKIKGESDETPEETVSEEEVVGALVEEGVEGEEGPAIQRESKSQKAIAHAARRLANYLEDKPAALQALYDRKMPSDFIKNLKTKSERIAGLRNEKALALAAKKSATKAEYDATNRHIKARGKVEPTATALTKKSEALKALMSLHLNRKG